MFRVTRMRRGRQGKKVNDRSHVAYAGATRHSLRFTGPCANERETATRA